jgi:hypothetical protein
MRKGIAGCEGLKGITNKVFLLPRHEVAKSCELVVTSSANSPLLQGYPMGGWFFRTECCVYFAVFLSFVMQPKALQKSQQKSLELLLKRAWIVTQKRIWDKSLIPYIDFVARIEAVSLL